MKLYVSRDGEGGNEPDAVMLSVEKPKWDGDCCGKCGEPSEDGSYMVPSGLTFGDSGEICYTGWLKVTGLKVNPGEVKLVELSVKVVRETK